MRINGLRKELTGILTSRPLSRPPAVRRSSRREWLYSTDILFLLERVERDSLIKELTLAGWECQEENSWLQMRKEATEPPEDWYDGPFGPEAGCCSSLLDRHPERTVSIDGSAQRALIKAGEEGVNAYETACLQLHREWAENLRRGEPLPYISRRYFGK